MSGSCDAEPAVVLLILPDETVSFDADGAGLITLHNLSPASFLGFRVSATDTQVSAAPEDGVLPPGKQVQVRLRLTGAGSPERVIVRYALLPQHARALQVRAHLDSLRDAWGSDARHCQHMLRCSRSTEPSSGSTARELVRAVAGGSGLSTRDRLAAAERLALLRSTQLLKAEQRIAQLEHTGGRGSTHGIQPFSPVLTRNAGGRVVRSRNAKLSLAGSHALVALAALIMGALYADFLIGM
jgi:hypothetical protein